MNEQITVFIEYNGEYYFINSKKDELLHSLFKKFISQTNIYDKNFNFMYNCDYLDPMKKLDDLFNKFSLHGNCIYIQALTENNCRGGFSFKFADISKQITEEHYFSDDAPSYRTVTRGINIYGICKFKKCCAYNKEVIVPLENVEFFDLVNERDNLLCPECEAIISPRTLGFHLCKYSIQGTKFENNNTEYIDFKGEANSKNSIQYYNPEKNGITTICDLKIKVIKFL